MNDARTLPTRPLPFRLSNSALLASPAEQLAKMREAGPVARMKLPLLGQIWVTTIYAATEQVMKGKDLFMLEGRNAGGRGGAAGFKWWMPRGMRLLTNNLLARDDPEHRRLRKLVDKAFARQGVKQMTGDVATAPTGILDAMAGEDEVDLVAAYIAPISDDTGRIGLQGT